MVNSPAFIFLLFIVLILSIALVICASVQHNRHSSQMVMAAVISPNQFTPPPYKQMGHTQMEHTQMEHTQTGHKQMGHTQTGHTQTEHKPTMNKITATTPPMASVEDVEANLNITSSIVPKT